MRLSSRPSPSLEKKISFAAGSTPARHRDTLLSVARARAAYIHGTMLYRYVFACASALKDGRAS